MKNEDDEYNVEHPICCSVRTFLWANYIWGVLSIAVVAACVVGLVVEEGFLVVFPPPIYIAFAVFAGWGLLGMTCGVFGQKGKVEACFLTGILLLSVGLIGQTFAFAYLLLYANDVGTLSSLDSAAVGAQDTFETYLADFARDEPDKWEFTQNQLKCCGIDFEAGIGLDEDELALLESGDKCEADAEALEAAREDETFDFDNDPIFGAGEGYFCKDKIGQFFIDNTPYIGAGLALYMLVQIVALIAGTRMYWVPDWLGGWQLNEADLQEVAQRKGLTYAPTKSAMQLNGTEAGGPAMKQMSIFNGARAVSQRVSFRFKNAMSPDPSVERHQPLLKRLSLRPQAPNFPPPSAPNQLSIGFGNPNPAHNIGGNNTPQPPTQPPPGMFQRLSNRILTPFGKGLISFPPPNSPGGARFSNAAHSGSAQNGNRQMQQSMPKGYGRNERYESEVSQQSRGNSNARSTFNSNFAPPPLPTTTSAPGPGRSTQQSNPASYGTGRSTQYSNPQQSNQPSFGTGRSGQYSNGQQSQPPVFGQPSSSSMDYGRKASAGSGFGGPPAPSFGRQPSNGGGFAPPAGFMPVKAPAPSFNGGRNTNPPASYSHQAPPQNTRFPISSNNSNRGPPPPVAPRKKSSKTGGGFGMGFGRKKSKKAAFGGGGSSMPPPPMGGAGRGGLLAQIQQGQNLSRTRTDDRSAPKV